MVIWLQFTKEILISTEMWQSWPRTGLGEAGLFWDGKALRPFATEGGHSEFSPRNKTEVEFYEYLNSIYGIVSWETVISGQDL